VRLSLSCIIILSLKSLDGAIPPTTDIPIILKCFTNRTAHIEQVLRKQYHVLYIMMQIYVKHRFLMYKLAFFYRPAFFVLYRSSGLHF
jgi:hypothetical protein